MLILFTFHIIFRFHNNHMENCLFQINLMSISEHFEIRNFLNDFDQNFNTYLNSTFENINYTLQLSISIEISC